MSRTFTAWPEDRKNPKGHENAPFTLSYAGGRSEGRYDTIDQAVAASRNGGFVKTLDGGWIVGTVEVTEDPTPPAPCGYCRRCAIHDDPGGCLEVERWEREHPVEAIAAIIASDWMTSAAKAHRVQQLLGSDLAPLGQLDEFDRAAAEDLLDPAFP